MHIFHCWHRIDDKTYYEYKRTKCKKEPLQYTGSKYFDLECCICGKRKKGWIRPFYGI